MDRLDKIILAESEVKGDNESNVSYETDKPNKSMFMYRIRFVDSDDWIYFKNSEDCSKCIGILKNTFEYHYNKFSPESRCIKDKNISSIQRASSKQYRDKKEPFMIALTRYAKMSDNDALYCFNNYIFS